MIYIFNHPHVRGDSKDWLREFEIFPWSLEDFEAHVRLQWQLLSLYCGKESDCQCRRCEFNPWVGKIPWRKKWQPTPVFLPGKSHGQRSLAGYSPWDCKESILGYIFLLWCVLIYSLKLLKSIFFIKSWSLDNFLLSNTFYKIQLF